MGRRHSNSEDCELNVASMLDMAFQLLTFFILTFKPPPPEGQMMLQMPPPQAVLGAGTMSAGENENIDPSKVKPVTTLTITVVSGGGGIDALQVGVPGKNMTTVDYDKELTKLNDKLAEYVSAGGFEQVIVQGSPALRWEEMLKVLAICSSQKLPDGTTLKKLSFVSLPENQ